MTDQMEKGPATGTGAVQADEQTKGAATGTGLEDRPELQNSKHWLDEIKNYHRVFDDYTHTVDEVDCLYSDLEKKSADSIDRQFQIFWANMEVLRPSIYSRPPQPAVVRRFKGREDVSRHAAEILERMLTTSFDMEDIDITMRHTRDDLALSARGVIWLRYSKEGPLGEKVCYDHVDRKDFAHEVARKWKEVGWVARQSWLTSEQGERRFPGKDFAKAAAFVDKTNKDDDSKNTVLKAPVWEIWSKTHQVVVWVTAGVGTVLDSQPPYLSLDNFFPCPRPTYATLQRSSLIPVPDVLYYRDQLEEINELTARISALAESLRMKGLYAAGLGDISEAVEAAMNNVANKALLIPVPNTANLGGATLKDSIIWLPIREIAQTITDLVALRQVMIEDVYQLTGLSDIMRGATDPNETLGAQQLKSQYGSIRVRDKQQELVRIAANVSAIAGEIMAENFSPQTIMAMSQYDELPSQQQIQQQVQQIQQQIAQAAMAAATSPQAQMALQDPKVQQQVKMTGDQAHAQIQELEGQTTIEDVLEYLRNERLRPFNVNIETDSTIVPDEQATQRARVEFLGALSQSLASLSGLVEAQPQSAPFAAEVLKFSVEPFRAGRTLMDSIETFAEQMQEQAKKPKPNPAVIEAQAKAKNEEAQTNIDAMKAKTDADKDKADVVLKKRELDDRMTIEKAKLALQAAGIEGVSDETISKIMDALGSGGSAVLDEMRESREQMAEFMRVMVESMNAPKRVVRDASGSPVGVEPATENRTVQ